MNIVHRGKQADKVNANALLGFSTGGGAHHDDEDDEGFGSKDRYKTKAIKLQDKEGIDFSYYFSTKYTMKNSNQQRGRGDRGRGRGDRGGRGRGDRGGRGRGRGGHDDTPTEGRDGPKSRIVGDQKNTLRGQVENEKKLAMIYQFLNKFIREEFEAGKYEGKKFTFPKA